MKFYTIRLKQFPDRYIGKKDSSYALVSDGWIETRRKNISHTELSNKTEDLILVNAHWFTKAKYAKVWTNETALKSFLTYCGGLGATFGEFELLCNGEPISFDEFTKAS